MKPAKEEAKGVSPYIVALVNMHEVSLVVVQDLYKNIHTSTRVL